ncbi:serine/threonine protein phosphatase 1 [Sphingomonas aerolata]|uniref:Serine/threonine protein phosphatase 1 n=1 Tax=Sphingomonas aerolata TaxID=185951 RepID=A0A2T4YPQ7_9SPHN|nr:serine/threonine protein phosphatase 1 [Sphingomonas aerolata]
MTLCIDTDKLPTHGSTGQVKHSERVYAIGDIHGRFDLFGRLVAQVARDNAARPIAKTQIVLLGNIIDRGPDAARMIKGCMQITASNDNLVVLKGNHEDMMADALGGNLTVYGHWLHFGGRETLLSWGVHPNVANGPATKDNLAAAAQAVGEEVVDWLQRLPLHHKHGPYLFVHAGIRPGVAIDEQEPDDFMWIEDEFLNYKMSHGFIVVHGHSLVGDKAVILPNRIGINTDAYTTDKLTALGIDNCSTWTLSTANGVSSEAYRMAPLTANSSTPSLCDAHHSLSSGA